MNKLRNKVQLIGHLGMDPEVKHLDGEKTVAKLSLATKEVFKNGVVETQWHNLVAWGRTAGIAEKYLKKGSEVAVEGKLINRSYNDKDGNKKYISEIIVNEFVLLGAKMAA